MTQPQKASFQRKALLLAAFLVFAASFSPVYAGLLVQLRHAILTDELPAPRVATSQNVAVLSAALHADPRPIKGGGDLTVLDGTAIMPESGPLGNLADVDQIYAESDQISLYVVREGDNLSQIAEMFGVSVNTIMWANDVKRGGVIQEGQTLAILPVSGVKHTVSDGDTIAAIAKKYSGDVEEILEYNGIAKGRALSIGEEVVVPNGRLESASGSQSSPRSAPRSIASAPSYDDYYMRPVQGGRRSQGYHGYNAVDLAVPYGTAIFAAAPGRVVISRYGWNGGYGNYVVIQHANQTQTLYAHNNENIVSAGQNVVQGQVIGYVGSTGRSTGPHVHFEVRGAKNPF